MRTDQIPANELGHLTFVDHGEPSAPRAPRRTVEALLHQNEDLSARMRVLLRRLEELEILNQRMEKTHFEQRQQLETASEELAVWREKESAWSARSQHLETEIAEIRLRFPQLLQMEAQLQRYQRYHQRVKGQIIPYIKELKGYSDGLQRKIRDLRKQLAESDDLLRVEQNRSSELERERQQDKDNFSSELAQLQQIFEKEKAELQQSIEKLLTRNSELVIQLQREQSQTLHQDRLANDVLMLERKLRESEGLYQTELQREHEERLRLRQENGILLARQAELDQREDHLRSDNHQLRHQIETLTEQLSRTREQWLQVSQRNENLLKSTEALERLNQDLARRTLELPTPKNKTADRPSQGWRELGEGLLE